MPEFPPLTQRTPDISESFDRIVRKDIRSANWDGGGSLEGGKDTAATTGYLIDYGTGAAQFQAIYAEGGSVGNLTIDDELTVQDYLTLGAGGVFRTAASGQRIEMTNTDKNYIYFYSGDADEEQAGYLQEATSGAGVTRTIQFGMKTPAIDPDDQTAAIVVRSGSPDGTTYAPGIVVAKATPLGLGTGMDPQFRIEGGIEFITNGNIEVTTSDFTMKETDASTWLLADTSARQLEIKDAAGATGAYINGAGQIVADGYILATANFPTGTGYPIMRASSNSLTSTSYSFQADANSGIGWQAADTWWMAAGGTKYVTIDGPNTSVLVTNGGLGLGIAPGSALTSGYFYNVPPTTAATANPAEWVLASGTIYYLNRSTSSRRYKAHINYDTQWLADVDLKPVRFWSMTDEQTQIGLIAEDIADALPEAAALNDDGEVENYDQRSVMAVLAAKVNRLEGIVL